MHFQHGNTGKVRSVVTRERMRQAKLNMSPETRKKMSESAKRLWALRREFQAATR